MAHHSPGPGTLKAKKSVHGLPHPVPLPVLRGEGTRLQQLANRFRTLSTRAAALPLPACGETAGARGLDVTMQAPAASDCGAVGHSRRTRSPPPTKPKPHPSSAPPWPPSPPAASSPHPACPRSPRSPHPRRCSARPASSSASPTASASCSHAASGSRRRFRTQAAAPLGKPGGNFGLVLDGRRWLPPAGCAEVLTVSDRHWPLVESSAGRPLCRVRRA